MVSELWAWLSEYIELILLGLIIAPGISVLVRWYHKALGFDVDFDDPQNISPADRVRRHQSRSGHSSDQEPEKSESNR